MSSINSLHATGAAPALGARPRPDLVGVDRVGRVAEHARPRAARRSRRVRAVLDRGAPSEPRRRRHGTRARREPGRGSDAAHTRRVGCGAARPPHAVVGRRAVRHRRRAPPRPHRPRARAFGVPSPASARRRRAPAGVHHATRARDSDEAVARSLVRLAALRCAACAPPAAGRRDPALRGADR